MLLFIFSSVKGGGQDPEKLNDIFEITWLSKHNLKPWFSYVLFLGEGENDSIQVSDWREWRLNWYVLSKIYTYGCSYLYQITKWLCISRMVLTLSTCKTLICMLMFCLGKYGHSFFKKILKKLHKYLGLWLVICYIKGV